MTQQKGKAYRSKEEIVLAHLRIYGDEPELNIPAKVLQERPGTKLVLAAMEEYATQEVGKAEQMMRDEFESYKKEKDRQDGWTDEDMMQAWTAGWGPTYSDGFKEWLEDYKESKSRNNQQST